MGSTIPKFPEANSELRSLRRFAGNENCLVKPGPATIDRRRTQHNHRNACNEPPPRTKRNTRFHRHHRISRRSFCKDRSVHGEGENAYVRRPDGSCGNGSSSETPRLVRQTASRKSCPDRIQFVTSACPAPMRNSIGTASSIGSPDIHGSPMHQEVSAVIEIGIDEGDCCLSSTSSLR